MPDDDSLRVREFVRMFRLISTAKEAAEALQLRNLVHLTNMALLQVALDWDGLDPERDPGYRPRRACSRESADRDEERQGEPARSPSHLNP